MDSDDLDSLYCQGEGGTERSEEAGSFLVPQELADEAFAGMAD
jgi:hypothetical protein